VTLVQHAFAPGWETSRAWRGAKRAIVFGALAIVAGRSIEREVSQKFSDFQSFDAVALLVIVVEVARRASRMERLPAD
jgi:hypothetical protein